MEFYEIECKGSLILEKLDSLPSFNSEEDEGRLVYNTEDGLIYYGDGVSDEWSEVTNVNTTPSEHNDLDNINSDDHHTRYTDDEAVEAVKGTVANPGYAIYYTNTNQENLTPGFVQFDNGVKDSHNVDGRITQEDDETFHLQSGYYIISYYVTFFELESTPDVWAQIYNRTDNSSIYWSQTRLELDGSSQRGTLSFSFPYYIENGVDISLQVDTSSNQRARVEEATIAIHIVY